MPGFIMAGQNWYRQWIWTKGAFLLFYSYTFAPVLRKLFSILSWLPSKAFLFLVGPGTLESMQSIWDVNFYVNYLLWFQVIIKPCQWKCKQNRVSREWGIDIAAHCNQPLLKIHLISWVFFYEMHYSCNKIHREEQLNCNFWEDSSSKRWHFHYLNQCSRSCLHEGGTKWTACRWGTEPVSYCLWREIKQAIQ